jgi:hypothetical protein
LASSKVDATQSVAHDLALREDEPQVKSKLRSCAAKWHFPVESYPMAGLMR